MMLRKKSNRKSQWRAIAALPALGLAALLLSTPVVADGLQSISTAEITKKNANDDRQQHNNVMNITLSADSAGDTQDSSKNAYVSYIYTSQTDSISLQRDIAFDASDTAKVQIFVNGKPVSEEEFKKISPDDIKEALLQKKETDIPAKVQRKQHQVKNEIVEVDLHIHELLDDTTGMGNAEMLNYQLDVFRQTLEEYKHKKGQKIVFIHGKGDGVLRRAWMN